jgi:hypothetical protein
MIERLRVQVEKAGVTNLKAVLGDTTQPHVRGCWVVDLALGKE